MELNQENGRLLGLKSEKIDGGLSGLGNNSTTRIACHDLREDPLVTLVTLCLREKMGRRRELSGLGSSQNVTGPIFRRLAPVPSLIYIYIHVYTSALTDIYSAMQVFSHLHRVAFNV